MRHRPDQDGVALVLKGNVENGMVTYYMLVRFVAMVVFGVMAYQHYMKQKMVATVILKP